MNKEITIINKKKRLKIFLNLISDYQKKNALYYLSKEDIINLMRCSKYVYSFVNDKNLLLRNLIKNNELQ